MADSTDDTARRIEQVLWNDPGTGVMRRGCGYEIAIECAKENGLNLPMIDGSAGDIERGWMSGWQLTYRVLRFRGTAIISAT